MLLHIIVLYFITDPGLFVPEKLNLSFICLNHMVPVKAPGVFSKLLMFTFLMIGHHKSPQTTGCHVECLMVAMETL